MRYGSNVSGRSHRLDRLLGGFTEVVADVAGHLRQHRLHLLLGHLLEALERALSLFRRPEELRRMQVEAVLRIHEKHTWDKVMKAYLKLYEKARLLRRGKEPNG